MEEKKRYWEGNICVGPDTASDITTTSGSTVQQVLDDHEERIEDLEAGFELIEEITLEEDVTSIERTQTPDGKTYNFKSLYIEVFTEIDTGNGYITGNVGQNTAWYTNGAIGTVKKYSSYLAEIKNGRIFMTNSANGYPSKTSATTLYTNAAFLNTESNSITNFSFNVQTGFYLKTGTNIKIYGVWA